MMMETRLVKMDDEDIDAIVDKYENQNHTKTQTHPKIIDKLKNKMLRWTKSLDYTDFKQL